MHMVDHGVFRVFRRISGGDVLSDSNNVILVDSVTNLKCVKHKGVKQPVSGRYDLDIRFCCSASVERVKVLCGDLDIPVG